MDQGGYERRPDLRHKRDVEVLRASPLPARRETRPLTQHLQATVRPLPTPSRFAVWRSEHYVADQAIRVGLIATGALGAVALTIGGLAVLIAWALGALSGLLATAGGLVGVGIVGGVLVLLARTRSAGPSVTTTVTTSVTTTVKR